jgi:Secretion system C-terminal sorting domain
MKTLLLIVYILIFGTARANTYYISPSGNDASGDGTITKPWKTLFKATSTISVPGDIIRISAGTYTETKSSSLAPGVSIEGEGATTIIKASFSTTYIAIIYCNSVEGTNGNQHISNLKMDGQGSTSWAIQVQGRSNFSIYNCTITAFAQRGIVWGGRGDNTDAPPAIYATGNSFYNNTVTNCASFDGIYGYGCLNIGGQNGMLIHDNTITTTGTLKGWPIKLWNDGHLDGCKIYNNVLKRDAFPYGTNGENNYFDFAIELFNQRGLEIYGNTIEGSIDLNFQTKGIYDYSIWIHDNTIGRATQAAHCETGVWLEFQTEDCIIENNVFKSISQPIMFSLRPLSFMNNITIKNNLAYNIGKTDGTHQGSAIGILVSDNSTNYTAANWYVYNNTFLSAPGASSPYYGINMPGGNVSSNVKVINNIVSGFYYLAMSCDFTSHVNGLQIQNNSLYNNGSNNSIGLLNGNAANYTNSNNQNNNPNLDANYRPNTGSPLINAGINVGLPYNGAAPDIGYYETGSQANTILSVNAGPDQTITLPVNNITLTGTATAPNGGSITTYAWSKIAGPANTGAITNPASATSTVTGLVQGTYQYELKVTDNNGAIAKDTMQLDVNPAPINNLPPTANAGNDQSITLPINTITLSGIGTASNGNIVAYSWTKITGSNNGIITNPGNPISTVTGLVQGTYQYELKVTDNNGAIAKDTMQVVVNPAILNTPPIANAGKDQSIALPINTITLDGIAEAPNSTISSYSWSKIAGPTNSGVITNPNDLNSTVTGLVQGVYQYELKVTDNNGAIVKDTMQVTVNPPVKNQPPASNAGPDQSITLPTNTITLSGSGTDPNGSILSYSWTKIIGSNASITSANAASSTVTGLVEGIYQFELKVTDNNGAVAKDTMMVTVNPAPVPPSVNAGADQSITLPTNTITLSGTANPATGNTIVSFNWLKITGPASSGSITSANTSTTTVTGLIPGIYQFELRVTDNNGTIGKDTMQLIVYAPNVAPTVNAGADQSITLPANSINLSGVATDIDGTINAVTWTKISGGAAVITNINSLSTSVTGLIKGIYLFELRATDNSGAGGKDTIMIIVNAANIPPVANAGADQSIRLPANSATLKGSGTDVDGTIASYSWRQLSGPVDKLSSTNTSTVTLNGLIEGVYEFELTVTDNGGAIGKDSTFVTINNANFSAASLLGTLSVYPNPVVDFTTLSIHTSIYNKTLLLIITDIQGRPIYKKQIIASGTNILERLNMSNFAKGTYFATIYFDSKDKQTVKVIKN